jgi:hypothetical protein
MNGFFFFLKFERNKIKNNYSKFMNEIKRNVKYFPWLEKVKFDNKLNITNWIIKQDNNEVVHEESSSFQSIKIRQGTTKLTGIPNQMVQYE